MLKQIWNKIKDFWFSLGEQEPDDYFYLKNGSVKWFRSLKPDVELTHREVQQIRSLLKRLIEEESFKIQYDKGIILGQWNLCNKDDPNTKGEFSWLNYFKDRHVKSKAKLKKLVNLQTKLKRLKGI
jgi:hypothetical protein